MLFSLHLLQQGDIATCQGHFTTGGDLAKRQASRKEIGNSQQDQGIRDIKININCSTGYLIAIGFIFLDQFQDERLIRQGYPPKHYGRHLQP